MTYTTSTAGSAETQSLAARLARLLKGGEVIELVGDVGSGKTTFIQGLASGLDFDGEVTSPTFTLSRVYPISRNRQLHHFDLYRLQGHDVVSEELAEVFGAGDGIVAIEWPGQDNTPLPPKRLMVEFEPLADPDSRTITFTALDPALSYLIEGLSR